MMRSPSSYIARDRAVSLDALIQKVAVVLDVTLSHPLLPPLDEDVPATFDPGRPRKRDSVEIQHDEVLTVAVKVSVAPSPKLPRLNHYSPHRLSVSVTSPWITP